MSKKLIAVASAVALGLTALVGVPANAATFSTSVFDASQDAAITAPTTALLAAVHTAPENNALQHSKDVTRASNTAVRFDLSGVADKAITVSSSGGVKVLAKLTDADNVALTTSAGSTTLTGVFATAGTYSFYAFTTSTTAGTVTITSEGNSQVYFLKSKAGKAYNVSGKFPTSLVVDAAAVFVYATVTDVFGNVINADNAANTSFYGGDAFATSTSALKLSGVNAAVAGTGDTWSWDTTEKAWKSTGVTTTSSGQAALALNLTTTDRKVGFAAPRTSLFQSINSGSLTEQVAALTAQVAALQATVAKRVTKKRYNTLARKWNKAFPTQKVALKK
jgi:hypothetical protein